MTDFADAHRRHLEDADLLFENARWANADHLYGLSVECGLKAIMQQLGMDVDDVSGAPREREHRQHMPGLWPVFMDFVDRRRDMPVARTIPDGERFGDWSIHDRYAHRKWFQRDNVETHRREAQEIFEMVERMIEGS